MTQSLTYHRPTERLNQYYVRIEKPVQLDVHQPQQLQPSVKCVTKKNENKKNKNTFQFKVSVKYCIHI